MYTAEMSVDYACISEADFTSAKARKRKIDDVINDTPQHPCSSKSVAVKAPEQRAFYQRLSQGQTKPSILSLIPEHAKNYIPKSSLPTFPKPLVELYQSKFLELDYLLSECESIDTKLTAEMAFNVEQATKYQSRSNLWYKYRSGRVTASKMKQVCRTDPAMPSQSLIKAICYPEAFRFTSTATRWGCEHEKTAREVYADIMRKSHDDFVVADSGLVLNPEWSRLRASPDGHISCVCCGKGVVEKKNPYNYRHDDIHAVASERGSYVMV